MVCLFNQGISAIVWFTGLYRSFPQYMFNNQLVLRSAETCANFPTEPSRCILTHLYFYKLGPQQLFSGVHIKFQRERALCSFLFKNRLDYMFWGVGFKGIQEKGVSSCLHLETRPFSALSMEGQCERYFKPIDLSCFISEQLDFSCIAMKKNFKMAETLICPMPLLLNSRSLCFLTVRLCFAISLCQTPVPMPGIQQMLTYLLAGKNG